MGSESRSDPMRRGDTLHTENQETCTTYNMLKVGRMPLYLSGYINNLLDFFSLSLYLCTISLSYLISSSRCIY